MKAGRRGGRVRGEKREKLCPRDTYRVQIHASRAFTPVSLVIVSREPLHGYSLMGFQAPHDPFHSAIPLPRRGSFLRLFLHALRTPGDRCATGFRHVLLQH